LRPRGTGALAGALDALGRPLDGGGALRGRRVRIVVEAPPPHLRAPVQSPFWTGVKVLDALLTLGRGARVGAFGAPGVGKSTLLEAIVGGCHADAVVVALIGERGREAQRWIANRGRHTTIVCATSDRAASERVAAAQVAVAHACALRERGLDVLLLFDSLARFAAALREVALAAGEAAGRGGYPPSVFAELARLAEAAGPTQVGCLTMIATVLDDGGERDPVSDAARALLDGHIALSPRLAQAGRFPAVDVLASASRTMASAADPEHLRSAAAVRGALALLERVDDARRIGIDPVDATTVRAIAAEERLEEFLRQDAIPVDPRDSLAALREVAQLLDS
jgi:type III secretion protein N (ATPase)